MNDFRRVIGATASLLVVEFLSRSIAPHAPFGAGMAVGWLMAVLWLPIASHRVPKK